MKKVFLFLVFILFVSCKKELEDNSFINDDTSNQNYIEKEATSILDSITLNFNKDYGFNLSENISKSNIDELKTVLDHKDFKNKDFCQEYFKIMELDGSELNKYLEEFKNIKYYKDIMIFSGGKICKLKPVQTNYESSKYSCLISEDFIKKDLQNPSTADFSSFDCNTEQNKDGSYTILRKVSAQNSFGVEKEFIYKLTIGFKGGNWVEESNWELKSIRSEEYR